MQPKVTAIRKRTQIATANRMMFVWVAGVSILFGFSVVGVMFLTQMLFFNERVLNEKNLTVQTLNTNNANIPELEEKVRILNTNKALISSKSKPDDQAIQVILDALPSVVNSDALGASLQVKLLSGIDGLILNSLLVSPVVGIESLDMNDSIVDASSAESISDNVIDFTISVNGDETALKKVLLNLESSIRTIDITNLKIESQGKSIMLKIQGRGFYEPERVVELKDKTVK